MPGETICDIATLPTFTAIGIVADGGPWRRDMGSGFVPDGQSCNRILRPPAGSVRLGHPLTPIIPPP